ncbi:DUF1146 domain-containing protein [Acholeplasma laidlawii]|jgi:uncharacterized membrane protein YwzB|uniref:DUF1146 family protein n=1 Tax=Acholeplasma laidlawii TaxID=2148 RepID=UPI0018C35003|nr:DUF1146 domain-containing protein [Acholeplasma laidlawii]
MNPYVTYIVFWSVFVVGFFISFRILQAIEIEKYFKKYRLFEINAAYLILSLLTSYFLAKMLLDIIELFPRN